MIFNIKAIQKNFEDGFLIKQGTLHKLRWLDQDLMNMLFYGKIKLLPNRWNVMISNIPDSLDEYYLPEKLRNEYYEARQKPYIVHYVGKMMPCYTATPDLYEYFWKYARKTEFYEILLQQMTINYTDKKVEEIFQKSSLTYQLKISLHQLANKIFPKGSKRRLHIKNFLFRLKNWG